MNNKLFTFLDPLLGYIDNGRFFREPFRWLYVIFAVLNLLFPIFILAKVIEMDFFKYAEGKLILAFILLIQPVHKGLRKVHCFQVQVVLI